MQPPVQQTGDHHIPRQPGAMQEEEQGDGEGGSDAEIAGKGAARRQNGCQDHGADEQDRKGIGQETAHGSTRNIGCHHHGSILFLAL